MLTRILAAGVILAISITIQTSLNAQTAYPMVMSLEPPAAVIGAETEHTIKSRYSMYGASQIVIEGEGVTASVVPHHVKEGEKVPSLTSMKIMIKVAADAQPGIRDFRVLTPHGASTVGQLVIARDRVISETDDNNSMDKAQTVDLPSTICGRIERAEDVDYFRFSATSGTHYVFHVLSMRLQDRIHDLQQHSDPLLALRSGTGATLAVSDNHYFADPFIAWQCPADGEYLLEIRDVRYQGNQYWTYAIEAHSRPHVFVTNPVAINPQQSGDVNIVGTIPDLNLAAHIDRQPSVDFESVETATQINGQPTNPFQLCLTTRTVVAETDAENHVRDAAQVIEIGTVVEGAIEQQSDVDLYRFAAKKGEQFNFEVVARRVGSTLDSVLRILDSEGRSRSENDDLRLFRHTHADSRIDNWSAPEDGDYFLEVRDLHLRGGDDYVYALVTKRAIPEFALYLDTDKTQLTPGTSGVLFVNAERFAGFDEEIRLEIKGLPEGVTADCGRILKSQRDGCIILTAAPDAGVALNNVSVFGTAMLSADSEQREMIVQAVPLQETYQPGGGRGHWPVDTHAVAVSEAADLLAVNISPAEITLKPGESQRVDVEIVRAEGFDKNVQLDALFRHLSSVYADTLPKGRHSGFKKQCYTADKGQD